MFNGRDPVGDLIGVMLKLLVIFVPLGVWKLIEILIYIFSHLHWS